MYGRQGGQIFKKLSNYKAILEHSGMIPLRTVRQSVA